MLFVHTWHAANNALQSDTCKQAAFGYANPRPLASAAELGCYASR